MITRKEYDELIKKMWLEGKETLDIMKQGRNTEMELWFWEAGYSVAVLRLKSLLEEKVD